MSTLRRITSKIILLIAGVSFFSAWAGAIGVHVLTIIMAYHVSGLSSAAVVFLMPVVSELYWLYKMWHMSSPFLHSYVMALLCPPVLTLICFTLGYTASKVEPASS